MTKVISATFVRGNPWTVPVRYSIKGDPGFDWEGLTATLLVRKYRLSASPALATISVPVSFETGSALAIAHIPGSVTATFPDCVAADLRIQRTSPVIAPVVTHQFNLKLRPSNYA